eukprot:jgi/Undpi1/3862/HiC_scaffold_16.g07230.m1
MKQQQQQRQGSNLWWRRHRKEARGISVHLTPVDTGVPEIVPHDLSPADSASIAAGAQQKDRPRARSNRSGLLVLSTVPLVWGTYGPSVKYLYQMGESTPGLVFNFACYAVSVLTLAAVAGINNARKREGDTAPKRPAGSDGYATRAGLELGGWLFLGGTVQVWGLELTSASRAAFLVQLTTVIVPVLEAVLRRQKLKPQVWLACAMATLGVALVSLGGVIPPGVDAIKFVAGSFSAARLAPSGIWAGIMSGNFRGDLLVALSAVFYSLHVVRLGVHVSKVDTLSLARAKALAELGFSALSVLIAAAIGGQADNFGRFASALASKPDLLLVFAAVVVWNGALTSAYAMWAQTRGQASVAPSEANLVYSLQPLWSTLFAVVILKESFRGVEAAGAALVLLSLFLATTQYDAPVEGLEDDAARKAA